MPNCGTGGNVTLTYFSKETQYGQNGTVGNTVVNYNEVTNSTAWTEIREFSWDDADMILSGRTVN